MEHRAWVSRYRDELKGLAILWVIFFHSQLILPGNWDLVRQLGYGGVDIFFFIMGFGLYHSLIKNTDLRGYTSRRLWRILPAYLPVLVVWMATMYPTYGLSPTETLRGVAGNLTMTGYWLQTPRVFNWFANGQFFFILIAPVCFALLTNRKKPAAVLVGLLIIAGLIGFACIGQKQLMGASRLPLFLLGIAFGMDWPVSKKRGAVRGAYIAAFAVGLTALLLFKLKYTAFLNDFGMYWYPFALITPPLCVFIAWLLNKTEKARALFAPLRVLGRASFEIYLLNIWTVELAKLAGADGAGLWIALCAGDLLLGVGYHMLVTRAVQLLKPERVDSK